MISLRKHQKPFKKTLLYYAIICYSSSMKIIDELEKYRLENKITQQKLAKKLGVAFTTVNRWFNGKTKPSKIQTYHIKKLLKKGENEHGI